ncbi:MAG TPA: N-acetylmannosamine-6-phosphate 2-epimerase [Terriglobia bacterium]|nr:N-acetylmannosamine-6-phosphate 2-epimerase [Terriglobia bacterium]
MRKKFTLSRLKNGLIISCQPRPGSALDRSNFVAAMATVAAQQGAAAVRIRGARDIRAVCRAVKIPVLGIEKINDPESEVYITPTLESVRRVYRAGAQIIAMDATERARPGGLTLAGILCAAKSGMDALFMADVATLQQGVEAARLGFDLVGTTLFGYTNETRHREGPAFDLARRLVREVDIPVILEGRVHEPGLVRHAFELGVYAVVVGTAITDFEWLSRRFIEACPKVAAGGNRRNISQGNSARHTSLRGTKGR